jgi:hypothetical protein
MCLPSFFLSPLRGFFILFIVTFFYDDNAPLWHLCVINNCDCFFSRFVKMLNQFLFIWFSDK